MKNKELLEQTLIYIDKNLDKHLTLEMLAEKYGYSPYHFSRIFSWALGISLMNYVNKRKMEYACFYLSTEMKIIDIALSLGFETHSGFSKSFKKIYHCSPESYRLHASKSKPELIDLNHLDRYALGGIIMKPRIIEQD
ncbi:helix-turn-helix transcriptional regulator [Erysipelothrix urinaevulpis]|uniref:helix-turn-helix transcriptional regulator n=1 Tax=Erysipelothrix urinaevulpis TaxID=2683717 RepID=UPI00135AD859|nr:AraC family transcriptional regulator [Erysipelothrix urinaevulpis]